jgi:hypothetical protein
MNILFHKNSQNSFDKMFYWRTNKEWTFNKNSTTKSKWNSILYVTAKCLQHSSYPSTVPAADGVRLLHEHFMDGFAEVYLVYYSQIVLLSKYLEFIGK